ncbi:MAG: hypothetical protein KC502_16265 [Myxococcales bacterium]|nr:hypothetical protein [Myxococcales bacterium]
MTESTVAAPKREITLMGYISLLIGAGCLLIAGIGVVNTAMDLDLVLRVSGAKTPLPNSYDVSGGLAAVGLLIIGLTLFGGFVRDKFANAKGKPLVRVAILAVAATFLLVAGRAVQVVALVNTYGSMLAYYATDGDLDDVKSELAKSPSVSELDSAVSRAAQYNNAGALKLLLAAGANFKDESSDPEIRRCALGSNLAFVKVAVDHGVTPQTCANGEAMVHGFVDGKTDDAETAKIVKLLIGAGFSVAAKPEYEKRTALEVAKEREMPLTAAALSGQ